LIKLLGQNGWYEARCHGSHRIFKHPEIPQAIPVAFHGSKDIPPGTLNKILKAAGLK